MKNVCFLTEGVPSTELLNTYAKMTPGSKCVWEGMQASASKDEAQLIKDSDFCIVLDFYNRFKIPREKKITIQAHPYIPKEDLTIELDNKGSIYTVDMMETSGFGEWWIQYSYDELMAMNPAPKTKDLICIISNSLNKGYHKKRLEHLIKLCDKKPAIDIYGRIIPIDSIVPYYKGFLGSKTCTVDYWKGKEILMHYKYALEYDAGPTKNYFSERFYDAMLLWAMPIYWGGTNLEAYLPAGSFKYLDINGDGSDVIDFVNSGNYNLKDICTARELLLNKLQIWPRVWEIVKSL